MLYHSLTVAALVGHTTSQVALLHRFGSTGLKTGDPPQGDTAFAKLRVALRQLQAIYELRRVCWPVAIRQHLHNGRRAAPFEILSRTHKVLCPRKNRPEDPEGPSNERAPTPFRFTHAALIKATASVSLPGRRESCLQFHPNAPV